MRQLRLCLALDHPQVSKLLAGFATPENCRRNLILHCRVTNAFLSLSHKQQQTVFFLNSQSTPRSHNKAATPRFPRCLSPTHGCGKWQEHATSPLLTCCCIILTNSSLHSLDLLE
ncbi:hypothetical protein EV1_034005 [Malus domestica]